MPKRKWIQKLTIKKVIFTLILALILAGVVELFSYLVFTRFKERFTFCDEHMICMLPGGERYYRKQYDRYLGWDNHHSTKYGERPYGPSHGTALISTFGDSYTQCDQVKDHETWEVYLAEILQADVLNFGGSGFGVDQAYMKFQRVYPKVKTPIVILGLITENINRIVNVYRPFYYKKTGMRLPKPRFELVGHQLKLIDNPLTSVDEIGKMMDPEFIRGLGAHDWWYNRDQYPQLRFPYSKILLNKRMWLELIYGRGDKHIDDINPRPWENLWEYPPATDLLFAIMDAFVSEARAYDASPVILILPMKHQLRNYMETGEQALSVRMLQRYCAEHGYPCVETISAMAGAIKEHGDFNAYIRGHVTGRGNRVIADTLAQYLKANMDLGEQAKPAVAPEPGA